MLTPPTESEVRAAVDRFYALYWPKIQVIPEKIYQWYLAHWWNLPTRNIGDPLRHLDKYSSLSLSPETSKVGQG